MKHFLSKKEEDDSTIMADLDISFILPYLNKFVDTMPLELMLVKFYNLRAKGDNNTANLFRNYIKNKLKVNTDEELYKIISEKRYVKTVIKIKNSIDSLIFKEFGCEVVDAEYVSTVTATRDKIVIRIRLTK